jgi:phosphate transport system permease protein
VKRKRDLLSLALRIVVCGAAAVTAAVILFLVGYVLLRGLPHLTPSLFAWTYDSQNVSLTPALINTVLMTALSLLIAAPLGIFAAVYLSEYARRGNRLVRAVRMAAETLSGIPSIVYGLFGMLFFILTLGWGHPSSLLAGSCTLPSWCCLSSCARPRRRCSRCPTRFGRAASDWARAGCAPSFPL